MILLHIPFTGLGSPDYRGDEWFKRRIHLFHQYTLKSLLNQAEQGFVIWLSFRPEEATNPLIKTIKIPHKHVFTFGGIPIWDDKKENEEKGLLKRLKSIIPELKELVGRADIKMVNVGSDDMYSREVLKSVEKQEFKERTALVHYLGYVYSEKMDRLAEWNPTTHPPFYTLMIPNKTFLDPQKHFEFLKGFKSHEDVVKVFNPIRMPDRRYCVVVHDTNISTLWEHPFKGVEVYYEQDKREILKSFGIEI